MSCKGCGQPFSGMRRSNAKWCSTQCRLRHKQRLWNNDDIPSSEIDRLFDEAAARKRALRRRAA